MEHWENMDYLVRFNKRVTKNTHVKEAIFDCSLL